MMHLYSAGSAGPLSEKLADVLSEPPADPFTPEWLAVPSDGMRRWVTLELARHLGASSPAAGDGITANVVRAYPGTLRSAVLAIDRAEDQPDPWGIDRMVWSVLDELVSSEPRGGLPGGVVPGTGPSLYARARRIADLFDRYHLHRPHMVRQWSRGSFVDGSGRPIASHALWQARLWTGVRARIGEPSPPERLPALLRRLHDGEDLLDLPPRLVFFGFTLLPAGEFLAVARAAAASRDVHLFLLEPTRLDPDALLRTSPTPAPGGARLRSNDHTADLVEQPLLRSWGRLHRETALRLADLQSEGVHVQRVDGPGPAGRAPTLLGRLQQDIRGNVAPGATLAGDPTDDSVRFHSCFGTTRQVEVLRDALLHLLAAPGSDLTEDDIVVLCPSLDRFAPLIEAVFGQTADSTTPAAATEGETPDRRGAPALRYRVADRSIRSVNPVLSAASSLLQLVTGRFDVSSVLEFLALGPVRQRFGFDDDALGVIAEWMEATNVRWGLDPSQRQRQGLPGSVVSNTWDAALSRLLVGSSVFDEELRLAVGAVAPYGVEGGDVETAGRLAEAVGCLRELADEASVARPLAEWVRLLRSTCTELFSAERDMAWQVEALERVLAEVEESATIGGTPSSVGLEFDDVRKVLDERLDDKVGRADFFRGGITVTSMTPLRWVPFRVVCLLGMDQAAFGVEGSAGDDLSSLSPQIGDRDPRGEARETLLEAVLAARDHLVVVRDGRDVRTNQVVPRAVVTAELYESVLSSVVAGDRPHVAARLEVDHPRHPFDERCFEPGGLVEGTVWGFDRDELDGALARRGQSPRRPPFLDGPLEPVETGVIELSDLHRFLKNPTAAFFSERLGVRLPRPEDEAPTVLPVDIGGLEGWDIGTRLLDARLDGFTFGQWLDYERQLGTLPPPPLGGDRVRALEQSVEALLDAARRSGLVPGAAEPFPVDALLPDGTRVVGSVSLRLGRPTPGPAQLYYSRAKSSHRVAAWLDLMALAATDATLAWRSLAVSRPEKNGGDVEVTDLVPSPDIAGDRQRAAEVLAVAVDCYRRGMAEPIPLFPNFSYGLYRGKAGPGRWRGFSFPEDGDHPAVRLAFGECDFDAITHLAPRPTDPPGPKGRAMRFAMYLFRTIDRSTARGPGAGAARVPAGSADPG